MKKLTILFHRLGPYHITRLNSAARHFDVTCLELSGITTEYQWDQVHEGEQFQRITLFKEEDCRKVKPALLKRKVEEALYAIAPDWVAINGWWERGALVALHWCKKRNIPGIIMSESTHFDSQRVKWKEYVKKRIVGLCEGALVGGRPHSRYIQQLGMPAAKVQPGYDIVDNQYFFEQSQETRKKAAFLRKKLCLPERFILASSRFIHKKNLLRLIAGYGLYRKKVQHPFHLVLLGDGELREHIIAKINDMKLTESVHLPGFRQYHDLPAYYGLAQFFVHASTSEQWGLVINEAMATGLPVAVSERCGCAEDLVRAPENGLTFSPLDEKSIGQGLANMHEACVANKDTMKQKSLEIIREFSPTVFGDNLLSLVNDFAGTHKPMNLTDSLLLRCLTYV